MEIVSESQKRDEIRKALGLSSDAQASDVIKEVITRSGHTCSLLELVQIAGIMDGSVQLHITDRESGKRDRSDESGSRDKSVVLPVHPQATATEG